MKVLVSIFVTSLGGLDEREMVRRADEFLYSHGLHATFYINVLRRKEMSIVV